MAQLAGVWRRNLRNRQPGLKISRARDSSTLFKVIDELRGRRKETSPEIKAKLKAQVDKLQSWPGKLEADVSESLRNMRAQLEDLRGTDAQQTFPRSSISSVRSPGDIASV